MVVIYIAMYIYRYIYPRASSGGSAEESVRVDLGAQLLVVALLPAQLPLQLLDLGLGIPANALAACRIGEIQRHVSVLGDGDNAAAAKIGKAGGGGRTGERAAEKRGSDGKAGDAFHGLNSLS